MPSIKKIKHEIAYYEKKIGWFELKILFLREKFRGAKYEDTDDIRRDIGFYRWLIDELKENISNAKWKIFVHPSKPRYSRDFEN